MPTWAWSKAWPTATPASAGFDFRTVAQFESASRTDAAPAVVDAVDAAAVSVPVPAAASGDLGRAAALSAACSIWVSRPAAL